MTFKSHGLEIATFEESDLSAQYLSWLNNAQHMRYSRQSLLKHDFNSARNYLETFRGSTNNFLSIKKDGLLIGTATMYVNRDFGTCSAGIMIGSDYAGNGYGKIAWALLIGEVASSLGVRKVNAGTLKENRPMLRLFETSGMELEAVLKDEGVLDGKPMDIILYRHFL
jgi:RimJ/RimL family protein N-acetyltransferase